MAIWKTYRVADIIEDIADEKFVLPVIQRPLVWDEEKMELLFDTLLKGESFGGVMVIEEERNSKPLFNFRAFTKDGAVISSRQVEQLPQSQNFVIDGQQRLQSFYIGLNGSINGKVLYFDLFGDYDSEFEFKFENDSSKLPKKSKDNPDRTIPEHQWYLARSLLQRLKDTREEDQVAEEICKACNILDETRKRHVARNVKAFYKNIVDLESIGVAKVVINKTVDELQNRQRIVELFRRLNDGGTRLSSFDLVASVLKGFSWEMERFLSETLEVYEEIGLSQENLIKLIFILRDNHNKEMSSIDAEDAHFAIQNSTRIKNTLKSLKDFLKNAKLYEYFKSGNYSFVPLFFIAYHVYHQPVDVNGVAVFFDNFDTGNPDFPKMKKWLYHSLINGVFRSRGAGWIPYKTGIRKLLEKIKEKKGERFPDTEFFNVYVNHPINFTTQYDTNKLDHLDSSFIYYLIYDHTKTIRIQDIDHIMPKSILTGLQFDQEKINSIKNLQLLDYGTNRGEKNGKPFSQWVNNSSYVTDKIAFAKRHLIPNDETLWHENKFEEFISARAILILEKLQDCIDPIDLVDNSNSAKEQKDITLEISKPRRHGEGWSETESKYVSEEWHNGSTIEKIAERLERTCKSILYSLVNLGLAKNEQEAQATNMERGGILNIELQ